MAYLPIENYGMIGDMHTVALVGTNGSIDWCCYPYFDSPSIFAKILDDKIGGCFQIAPQHTFQVKQAYWPDTNVLMTKFFSAGGVAELIDFMPIASSKTGIHKPQIIRMIRGVRGTIPFEMYCEPAFNYARDKHHIFLEDKKAIFEHPQLQLGLYGTRIMEREGNAVVSRFTVAENQTVTFMLTEVTDRVRDQKESSNEMANAVFENTISYWRNWLGNCRYAGRWREMVYRSALTLKLLTFQPTGAIIAAPTCSLPEGIGGERNWDYRYTWIRDAAFTIYAFLRIGFTEEAAAFMEWVEARCRELNPDGSMQIMYGIDGRHELTEEILDHLDGYKGSKPVRIGNGAYNQLQLDIYGELMDSIYLHNKYGTPISYEFWEHLRRLTDWVSKNWQQKDEGIWEVRSGQQHFVYSKLMSWVALDRAIRLADKRSFPSRRNDWLIVRDNIYEEIMKKGWSEDQKTFVQYYGSNALDAANLMMPLVLFVSPSDPRMIATLKATMKSPDKGGLVSNGLVYRYNIQHTDDGLSGEEGTFNICTFWLVEAMTRAGANDKKMLEHARLWFEHMLNYSNHLGLFAEQTGPCGEALGNFPQAFTHLALISSAYNLDKMLGRGPSSV